MICRAGALTIAELAAAGVASILVPYPHAVDDHQSGNARFPVRARRGLAAASERAVRRGAGPSDSARLRAKSSPAWRWRLTSWRAPMRQEKSPGCAKRWRDGESGHELRWTSFIAGIRDYGREQQEFRAGRPGHETQDQTHSLRWNRRRRHERHRRSAGQSGLSGQRLGSRRQCGDPPPRRHGRARRDRPRGRKRRRCRRDRHFDRGPARQPRGARRAARAISRLFRAPRCSPS